MKYIFILKNINIFIYKFGQTLDKIIKNASRIALFLGQR